MAAAVPIGRPSSPTSFDDIRRSNNYLSSSPSHSHLASSPQSMSSRSSSSHTVSSPRKDHDLNPIHALAFAASSSTKPSTPQEVHILQVSESLHLESAQLPDSVLHKVGPTLAQRLPVFHAPRESSMDSNYGPPPPSPPSSFEGELPPPRRVASISSSSTSHPDGSPHPPITFEEPVPIERASSSSRDQRSRLANNSLRHRASAETKASHSTYPQSTLDAPFTDDPPSIMPPSISNSLPSRSAPGPSSHLSVDGYLQPPPPHRPSRRNTIGAPAPQPPASPPRISRMATMHGAHPAAFEDVGELADDIELHAEQIRRERMSKRAKAQQEAERALTRSTTVVRKADDGPLVGNLIGEDHVNYVLMYNMLTGIRTAVSRCQAKMRRPLTEEDYTARHKYSFDIVGNELTPSAKYDFKFKDYAPWVFRELREDYFHLDPADYLLSLTAKYILSELGSPGKSGSFFYFSRDYRFIIKTIHHSEHKFLRSILKKYYKHVKNNPHSLISRFYGLHRVKLPHGRKIHFVIMNNLFPAHKDVHETYDLKGSTVGREYPEEKAAVNPRAVLKDLNWINRGKTLELGPEKRALLTEQLRRDSELLKDLGVMDYSLLVGIHNMQRGNRDNVRRRTLKVFSPDMPLISRKKTVSKGPRSPEAIAMRRIMRSADPQSLEAATLSLPEEDTGGERQHFLFYQDEGGIRATDEANENMDTIYYLGVIDILTPYSFFKKVEHCWKGLSADRHKISPVPPPEYAGRFFSFMKAVMRGGEGGTRFKSE